jgi:hypothetical protein
MSTSRTFAYNTGSAIEGTEQVGNLAVGIPTAGFASTGLKWWNGPDEDLGYVVAHQKLSGQAGADGEIAYVGFWRTSALTNESFISLAEKIANQSFTGGTEAKTWLNSNGYWTSYGGGSSTGDYYLLASYSPADNNGEITFPNHNATNYSLNPNTVGQSGYAIYINQFDSTNNDMVTILDQLLGRSGTLTLTQGSNSVTYSFTDNAFSYGGGYNFQYWWDDGMESSPSGAITVTSAASGNFNNVDPITITIT